MAIKFYPHTFHHRFCQLAPAVWIEFRQYDRWPLTLRLDDLESLLLLMGAHPSDELLEAICLSEQYARKGKILHRGEPVEESARDNKPWTSEILPSNEIRLNAVDGAVDILFREQQWRPIRVWVDRLRTLISELHGEPSVELSRAIDEASRQ